MGILFWYDYHYSQTDRTEGDRTAGGASSDCHPAVYFCGAQLIGVLGIFYISGYRYHCEKMNDEGTIHLIK